MDDLLAGDSLGFVRSSSDQPISYSDMPRKGFYPPGLIQHEDSLHATFWDKILKFTPCIFTVIPVPTLAKLLHGVHGSIKSSYHLRAL